MTAYRYVRILLDRYLNKMLTYRYVGLLPERYLDKMCANRYVRLWFLVTMWSFSSFSLKHSFHISFSWFFYFSFLVPLRCFSIYCQHFFQLAHFIHIINFSSLVIFSLITRVVLKFLLLHQEHFKKRISCLAVW